MKGAVEGAQEFLRYIREDGDICKAEDHIESLLAEVEALRTALAEAESKLAAATKPRACPTCGREWAWSAFRNTWEPCPCRNPSPISHSGNA